MAEGTTCVDTLPRFAKLGFTLAEVLITIGIIGIVAAMTIPNLIMLDGWQIKDDYPW